MPCRHRNVFVTVVVTLEDGTQLDEAVSSLDRTKLKDNDISVSFIPSNKLICIAHLPPRYSDEEFKKLVEQHGPVKFCYLMRSDITGMAVFDI